MKKIAGIIFAVLILALVTVELAAAQRQSIRIIPGPLYTMRVNGQIREVQPFIDNEGNLHLLFFRGLECLGEEIFNKDNVKTNDTYLENNGDWSDGYQIWFRNQLR